MQEQQDQSQYTKADMPLQRCIELTHSAFFLCAPATAIKNGRENKENRAQNGKPNPNEAVRRSIITAVYVPGEENDGSDNDQKSNQNAYNSCAASREKQ